MFEAYSLVEISKLVTTPYDTRRCSQKAWINLGHLRLPHPHQRVHPGGAIGGIAPVVNRTVGLKFVLYLDGGGTQVEGYVDAHANGRRQRFYKAANPRGSG
jgi:hypothetical protein